MGAVGAVLLVLAKTTALLLSACAREQRGAAAAEALEASKGFPPRQPAAW